MKMISITLFALYLSVGLADTYMHMPRGSNNRLNEQSANRQNANRLFDTQNNNRGGYNVGEFGSEQGFDNNAGAYATDRIVFNYNAQEWANNNAAGRKQSEEVFLEGSALTQTWTAQHGCGNPKNNCNMVLEYTCDTHPQDRNMFGGGDPGNANVNARQGTWWNDQSKRTYSTASGLRVQLKNGANTNTPNDPNNIGDVPGTFANNNNDNEGRHESEEWYAFAKQRDRNKGLFTADQKLQGDDSTKTRQNPGGTRRGLEVPEERDYFPYWKPTPFKPIAIFHNDVAECEAEMKAKSQVFEAKTACVPSKNQINQGNNGVLNNIVDQQNQQDCENAQGIWISEQTTMPQGYPFCVQAAWSQVNNLGNVKNSDGGGLPQNWEWTIPTVAELAESGCYVYEADCNGCEDQQYVRMITRLRYNMTTMDYAPYTTDASCNQNNQQGVQSPVEQNPTVDVGVDMQGLRLALNTAQTGRTFQDRSHVFRVQKKQVPNNVNQPARFAAAQRIVNVNVQGKRGNIVQTFPAVEYDFWPKVVDLKIGDCASFAWTGSNTHNNGNPAGDGQAGDAGEGRGGSDRSNLMQIMDKNSTFPAPLDKGVVDDFFANSQVFKTYTGEYVQSGADNIIPKGTAAGALPNPQTLDNRDAQAYFMSGGFWRTEADIGENPGNGELNVLLNNSPATMRSMTVCPEKVGTYEFTCTRNNNFSNRDQKLTINVSPAD